MIVCRNSETNEQNTGCFRYREKIENSEWKELGKGKTVQLQGEVRVIRTTKGKKGLTILLLLGRDIMTPDRYTPQVGTPPHHPTH